MEREILKRAMGPPQTNRKWVSFEQNDSDFRVSNNLDLSPLSWDSCFDSKEDVIVNGDSFRVYTAESNKENHLTFVFLHGAGHTALSWGFMVVRC